jgi:hypothetical protein
MLVTKTRHKHENGTSNTVEIQKSITARVTISATLASESPSRRTMTTDATKLRLATPASIRRIQRAQVNLLRFSNHQPEVGKTTTVATKATNDATTKIANPCTAPESSCGELRPIERSSPAESQYAMPAVKQTAVAVTTVAAL